MQPKLILNEAEYKTALDRVGELMSAEADTPEGDELDFWSKLIEIYEEKHYPIELPDPIAAIRFRMEQQGLRQVDLQPYIGSKSKVSEVLNYKRPLTISMIRKLYQGLGIPVEVLIDSSKTEVPRAFVRTKSTKKLRIMTRAAIADVKKEINVFLKREPAGAELSNIQKNLIAAKESGAKATSTRRLARAGKKRSSAYRSYSKSTRRMRHTH